MDRRPPETAAPPGAPARPAAGPRAEAGETLGAHLSQQALRFLRAARARETDPAGEAESSMELRAAARRIAAVLHTWEPLLDQVWAESLRTELGWLSVVLAREQRCAARLTRLSAALHRLTGRQEPAGPTATGAVRAAALLERRLTQHRSRARSAALEAFGSARFHAVADAVALLTSDLPLAGGARARAADALPPLTGRACRALAEAVEALPLTVAAGPYNAQGLHATLAEPAAEGEGDPRDLAWLRVRTLTRTARYALEVPGAGPPPSGTPDPARLYGAGRTLDRHRDASEAAAAAATAALTPRITPATAYALGVLHADQRAEVEAARYAFSTLWRQPERAATP